MWFKNRRAKYRKKQRATKSKSKDGDASNTNSNVNSNSKTSAADTKPDCDNKSGILPRAESQMLVDGSSRGNGEHSKDNDENASNRSSSPESYTVDSFQGEDNPVAVDIESVDAGTDNESTNIECDSMTDACPDRTTEYNRSPEDDSVKETLGE